MIVSGDTAVTSNSGWMATDNDSESDTFAMVTVNRSNVRIPYFPVVILSKESPKLSHICSTHYGATHRISVT